MRVLDYLLTLPDDCSRSAGTTPYNALRLRKGNHSSFLPPTVVGGRRPFPSEICAESDPPRQKA